MRLASQYVRVKECIYRINGRIVVRMKDPATGKRKDWPANSIEEAEHIRDKIRQEARSGKKVRRSITCDEWVRRWTTEKKYRRKSDSTNVHNHMQVRKFAEDFKGVPLSHVTRNMARDWLLEGRTPADGNGPLPSHRTPQRHRMNTVRALFNDAYRREDPPLVEDNPFAALGIESYKGRGGDRITILTEDEVTLLAACAEEVWGDYGRTFFGPMILVAAWSGVRLGELWALEWEDVDFKNEEIYVRRQYSSRTRQVVRPKGDKERKIALLPPAGEALRRVPKNPTGEGTIFWTPDFRARYYDRTHNYYWLPVRAAFWGKLPDSRRTEMDRELGKIPRGFDFYELRHFCATYLYETLGLPPWQVAKQLGHSDGGKLVMEVYGHPSEKNAIDTIKERFREQQRESSRKTG